MRISVATSSTLRDQDALARLREVVQRFVGGVVVDDCPDRNLYFKICTVLSVPCAAFAVASAFCTKSVVEAKLQQSVFMGVRHEVDAAAVAAIATARSPAGNELLPPKCDTAVAAVSSFYPDFGLIDKHCPKNVP